MKNSELPTASRRRGRPLLALGVIGTLASLFTIVALIGSGSALGDVNGCPASGTGDPQTSNHVSASAAVAGNDVTYYFSSIDASPSGGVPGLIEYCVYPDSLPDSVVTTAIGDNGGAWADPNFSFQRPDGNPSNIGFDGGTDEMGTATWNSGVPENFDRILLHINDPTECNRLYGGNPGTCFVLPGNPQDEAADLTVSKDANGSYDDTFEWDITKDVVQSGPKKLTYTVTVSHGDSVVSNVKVSGTITVSNPNDAAATIDSITDALDGTDCDVDTSNGLSIPANGSTGYPYECDLGDTLPGGEVFNTATIGWSEQTLDGSHLPAGSADTGEVAVSFTATEIDTCVDVTDTWKGNLATVCVGGDNPKLFTYDRTLDELTDAQCRTFDNTATFTTNDTKTTGSDDASIRICAPATLGYWWTHMHLCAAKEKPSTANCNSNGPWTGPLLPVDLGSYSVNTEGKAMAVFAANNCSNLGSGSNAQQSQKAVGCLAAQLLAAKLNVKNGSSNCINPTIALADAFLIGISYIGPGGTYSGITSAQRAYAITLKTALDNYNKGLSC
jgi:hypothetical protein